MKKASLDVVRGTLDVLILRALTWGPQHGYAVSQWIRERTDEELLVEEGALYPALYRMESKGWIEAEWGASDNNRRAKYYTLTLGRTSSSQAGARHLAALHAGGVAHSPATTGPACGGRDGADTRLASLRPVLRRRRPP